MPVNRTPDDVLLAIFAFLVQPVGPDAGTSDPKHCLVLTASYVCARWRTLTIGCPRLWTEIPLGSFIQAALFIERSRSMPVRLSLFRPQMDQHVSDVVKPLISRVRGLFLVELSAEEMKWWMEKLNCPAPLLEELHLGLRSTEFATLRSSFLADTYPALRSLSIQHISFPPTSPLFDRLRKLHVMRHFPMSYPDLLGVLRRIPNLETLVLEHVQMIIREDIEVERDRQVALPRLRRLELIRLGAKLSNGFLQHLALPATTRIHVDIPEINRFVHPRLPQALATQPSLVGLRRIDIKCSDMHKLASTILVARREADITSPEALYWRIRRSRYRPGDMGTFAHDVPDLLDTRAVEVYRISLDGPLPPRMLPYTQWNAALARFGALKTLCVVSDCPFYCELLHELSARTDEQDPLICPALQELELVRPPCDEVFWQALGTMVRSRRSIPASPFRRVEIREASGIVEVTHPLVREVSGLLEGFEVSAADEDSPL